MPKSGTSSRRTPPVRIQSEDGLLWKPRRGATSTGDEFLQARNRFRELHDLASWSPWVLDERASELEEAQRVMGEWTRAEPGFKPMTKEELDAEWVREDQEYAAARATEAEVRESRKTLYDAPREEARLALLEIEARHAMRIRELRGLQDGTLYPAMPAERRQQAIDERASTVAGLAPALERLRGDVGDPETVIDKDGQLPAERRELSLQRFSWDRRDAVRKARSSLADLERGVREAHGRDAIREAREQLSKTRALLEEWLAVLPLTADQMCSECPQPLEWHLTGRVTPIGWQGPCPAWPQWAARVRGAWEMIREAQERAESPAPAQPPQPLAVIPSGLPIADVISQLTALQTQYPDAEVRRGRANRWELWARTPPTDHPT